LTHGRIHALKRPAKFSFSAGILLFVLAAAVGLPREPKFLFLAVIAAVAVPTAFIFAFIFVFIGKWMLDSTPRPVDPAASSSEEDIELGDAGGEANRLLAEEGGEKSHAA